MWWHNWRYLVHLKDEALSPVAYKMEQLHVPDCSEYIQADISENVEQLIKLTDDLRKRTNEALDWVSTEFGVTKASRRLSEGVLALSSDDFVAEVRKFRKARLSPGDLSALRSGHAEWSVSAAPLIANAAKRERKVSDLVNEAYGLTANDIEMMWRTAPPRMPIDELPATQIVPTPK